MARMGDIRLSDISELETGKLLRVLVNGIKPARVYVLICGCSAWADIRKNPKAWNGWQIVPFAKCPACLEKDRCRKEG